MKELSKRDINLARMINSGSSVADASRRAGCSTKTVYRLYKEPLFVEYLEQLKTDIDQRIAARVNERADELVDATIDIIWTFNDSARRLMRIADDPKAKNSDKISAIKLLNDQYGICKVIVQPGQVQDPVSEPDVYQAEWMRKPQ